MVFDSETNEPTQIGIASWGSGCAEQGYPGVYARILAARQWIHENTGI